ncbi:MAG: tetratricopeptide repeat protein [Rhodobacter sp.]|nr:tetratricopeptide repeat protein [Rhodobacter sp.]
MTDTMTIQTTDNDPLATPRWLLQEGETEQAHHELLSRVKEVPGDQQAWYLLGVSAYRLQRPDEAVDHFNAAVRLDPADDRAHHGLALALEKLGRRTEAGREQHIALTLKDAAAAAVRPTPVAAAPVSQRRVRRPTGEETSPHKPPKPLIKMLGIGKRFFGNMDVQVTGRIRDLAGLDEPKPGMTPPVFYVRNFVLRTTDAHRKDHPSVSVEMRGARMQGFLRNGEEIVLDATIDPKRNILRAERATKVSTGEVFTLSGQPHRSIGSIFRFIGALIPWVVFLGILGAIAVAILSAA